MVRDATELRRYLHEAFETVLQERLRDLPDGERAAQSLRLRDAFALALENTPARADAVSDIQARILLASVIEATLGQGSHDDAVAERGD